MKKTLAAVAVLGAFAGSAVAADVTLYGVVDTGLNYSRVDSDVEKGSPVADAGLVTPDAVNKFEMKSGQQAGSRFGLKGAEEIGNGVKVGFNLESGFNSDTGTFRTSGSIFDREATLWVQGGFGKIAAGKMGSINQGVSSWGKVGMLSAFGTSYGDYVAQLGNTFSLSSTYDNMLSYESPDFAGFKVYAQYAMGVNNNENESSSDRYYAVGVTYNNGPAAAYLAVDSTNYKTYDSEILGAFGKYVDDSWTVTLGGSYDFEVAKVYFGAQYFDEVTLKSIGGVTNALIKDITVNTFVEDDDFAKTWLGGSAINALYKVKGYGLNASVSAPVAGGTAMFGVGYVDADSSDAMDDLAKDVGELIEIDEKIKLPEFTRWTVSAGYVYNLSKRTNVYGVVSYMQDKIKFADETVKPSATTAMFGLRHNF